MFLSHEFICPPSLAYVILFIVFKPHLRFFKTGLHSLQVRAQWFQRSFPIKQKMKKHVMAYKGNKMFFYCVTEKKKKPPAIFLASWLYWTTINAAVTSAYLHPQEVFFVLHNRSHLNSLMYQHLLQFLLQSKQKLDVN